MATLQQILGAKNLIGRIQAIKAGLAADILPDALLSPGRSVEGNYGTYRKVIGERRVARVAMYGSPSQVRELKGISEIPVNLMHTIESINFAPAMLQNLTNDDNEEKQKNATAEIARQTADFHDLFENLRVAAVTSLLAYGRLDFNAGGELLMPTVAASGAVSAPTGAMYAVDMGIPATNRTQLNVFGSNIISATWATTSNSIITQLNNLKTAALLAARERWRRASKPMPAGIVCLKVSSKAFITWPELTPGAALMLIWAQLYMLKRIVNSGPCIGWVFRMLERGTASPCLLRT